MPQIRRDDGVQFVIQPYRELLNIKQVSLLKREIRKLARTHGENICVFKRESGHFEAVFSRDQGFLLGETILEYFGKPRNLICCSVLHEKDSALLIVVKDGSVYSDAKVSYAEVFEELAALSTSNEKYDVYIYGDIPIGEGVAEAANNAMGGKTETFVLDKRIINSFKILSAPVLPSLRLNNALQLLPLELALTAPCFKNKFTRPIAAVIGLLLVSLFGYLIFAPDSSQEQIDNKTGQPHDPYELYNRDLATPAPGQILIELSKIIGNFMALPGWDLTGLEYKDEKYVAKIKQNPAGTMDLLQLWAKTYGIELGGNGGSVGDTMIVSSKLGNRPLPKSIYNLDQVVKIITNKLTLVVAKENIKWGKMNNYQQTKSVELEINFKDFSPLTFDLIGKLLTNFPVRITSISIGVSDNLFSGSIKLTIWGN